MNLCWGSREIVFASITPQRGSDFYLILPWFQKLLNWGHLQNFLSIILNCSMPAQSGQSPLQILVSALEHIDKETRSINASLSFSRFSKIVKIVLTHVSLCGISIFVPLTSSRYRSAHQHSKGIRFAFFPVITLIHLDGHETIDGHLPLQ